MGSAEKTIYITPYPQIKADSDYYLRNLLIRSINTIDLIDVPITPIITLPRGTIIHLRPHIRIFNSLHPAHDLAIFYDLGPITLRSSVLCKLNRFIGLTVDKGYPKLHPSLPYDFVEKNMIPLTSYLPTNHKVIEIQDLLKEKYGDNIDKIVKITQKDPDISNEEKFILESFKINEKDNIRALDRENNQIAMEFIQSHEIEGLLLRNKICPPAVAAMHLVTLADSRKAKEFLFCKPNPSYINNQNLNGSIL